MIEPGTVLTLEIEKPAAGGWMLARHHGQVVLVWGAIPGERVRARVQRVTRSVLYAETTEVMTASDDRRDTTSDWRCGGNVLAHVSYPRQLTLKGQILQDALIRIGRVPLAEPPIVIGSQMLAMDMLQLQPLHSVLQELVTQLILQQQLQFYIQTLINKVTLVRIMNLNWNQILS